MLDSRLSHKWLRWSVSSGTQATRRNSPWNIACIILATRLNAGSLLSLIFYPDDGDDLFLRQFCFLSTDFVFAKTNLQIDITAFTNIRPDFLLTSAIGWLGLMAYPYSWINLKFWLLRTVRSTQERTGTYTCLEHKVPVSNQAMVFVATNGAATLAETSS
jgi:hypothetical protein